MKRILTNRAVWRSMPELILALALAFSPVLHAQEAPDTYREVRVYISSRAEIAALQEAGMGLDHLHFGENYFDAVLNSQQLEVLKSSGKQFDILIDDLSAYYDQNLRMSTEELNTLQIEMKTRYPAVEGFEFGSMGGYYTFAEVVTELDSMRLLYPNLISVKQSIGSSIEGRPIWMVKISDNPDVDEGEPEVLYTALHHAREPQSMATLLYFMYYLLEHYGADPEVTFLVNNRELYFVPVYNVDGYVYNQQTNPNGGGYWRKNRRNNGNGSFGVDLNRNYGYQWGYDNSGSSPTPSSETYRGTAPFSEPETQAVRDFCNARQFKLALNYHTHGDLLIYPWGYINALTPDHPQFLSLAVAMTQYNGYSHGNSSQLLYPVNGGSDDWMYGEQTSKGKIFSMTPEVGPSFWPSPSQIYPLAQENLIPNLLLARGEGVITADDLDPLPPGNVTAYSDYTTPASMLLNWDDPTSLAGGDPLLPSQFTIEVERDGAFIAAVPGGAEQYTDAGLNDGQLYTYTLYTKVIATDSTSESVGAAWHAGGSPIPAAPTNLACTASATSASLTWNDPAAQEDGTPLDDLDHISIYRNGNPVANVAPGVQSYTDAPPPGFTYTYTVAAVDNETPPNASAPSNAVECFVGTTPAFLVWVGPDASGESAASGDSIFAALVANGVSAFMSNDLFEFGANLSIYEGIFVVLGIFPNNHEIAAGDPEGPALQAYLQNGGRLYLEGGDCFNYDPEIGGYNIRPWFGLNDGPDGSDDVVGVTGLNDLSAFSFPYAGESSWMDELQPQSGTISIWKNSQNADISGVFKANYGNGGKSIGVVPSFGGLVDNPAPLNPEKRTVPVNIAGSPGMETFKIRPPREEREPFVKKAAWYPELKRERNVYGEGYRFTAGGIELLANTKEDLMAAYLDMLEYSSGLGAVAGMVSAPAQTPQGCPVTAEIKVDMSQALPPNNYLGSFTATLTWNPALLQYTGNSGMLSGFTSMINDSNAVNGSLLFNGASVNGATGMMDLLHVYFTPVGPAGNTAALDLEFLAMVAATTFTDLMPALTVNDGNTTITEGGLLGDVNGDQQANSTDALLILSYDAALPLPQPVLDRINAGLGDVDSNGSTTSTDGLIVLSYDAGLSIPFPVGQPVCPPAASARPALPQSNFGSE